MVLAKKIIYVAVPTQNIPIHELDSSLDERNVDLLVAQDEMSPKSLGFIL